MQCNRFRIVSKSRRQVSMSSRNWKFSRLVVPGVGLLALALAPALMGAYSATGASAKDDRLAAIEASPNWKDGKFVNTLPQSEIQLAPVFMSWFERPDRTVPEATLPVLARRGQDFETLPTSGLRITWLGHSTLLVEIDGYRVLVDPVWAERASPFASPGRSASTPPPSPGSTSRDRRGGDLARPLRPPRSRDRARRSATRCPLRGAPRRGRAPRALGSAPERIVELDWWGEIRGRQTRS